MHHAGHASADAQPWMLPEIYQYTTVGIQTRQDLVTDALATCIAMALYCLHSKKKGGGTMIDPEDGTHAQLG